MRGRKENEEAAGTPQQQQTGESPPEPATYVPTPVPPPTYQASAPARRTGFSFDDGRWVLVTIAAVILIVIVAAAGFMAGYFVGNRDSNTAPLAGQQGQAGQRLQQQLQQRGESVIGGQVTSVTDSSVTIETQKGTQTVSVTADTRFPAAAAGGNGAGAGIQALQPGQRVFVVVKKAADGKLEAVAVRPAPAAGGQAPPAQQGMEQ